MLDAWEKYILRKNIEAIDFEFRATVAPVERGEVSEYSLCLVHEL